MLSVAMTFSSSWLTNWRNNWSIYNQVLNYLISISPYQTNKHIMLQISMHFSISGWSFKKQYYLLDSTFLSLIFWIALVFSWLSYLLIFYSTHFLCLNLFFHSVFIVSWFWIVNPILCLMSSFIWSLRITVIK